MHAHGGKHPRADALDTIDLDESEHRPIAPIMASDPLASADFRVIDRGSEARTLKIEVPRL